MGLHSLRVSGNWVYDLSAPYQDLPVQIASDWSLDIGSAAGQANRALKLTVTLAASATVDLDLASQLSPSGGAITPNQLHALYGRAVTPAGKGTVTPHATNGWTGFGSAYNIPFGNGGLLVAVDTGIAIEATNKVFTLTNTSAASCDFELYLLLRDT